MEQHNFYLGDGIQKSIHWRLKLIEAGFLGKKKGALFFLGEKKASANYVDGMKKLWVSTYEYASFKIAAGIDIFESMVQVKQPGAVISTWPDIFGLRFQMLLRKVVDLNFLGTILQP